MSQENKSQNKKRKSKKKISIFRLIIVVILLVTFIATGAVGGMVLATIKGAPEIDATKIGDMLTENSVILDQNGNLIEKIETTEYRTVVDLDKMPEYLINAFIAIEDERFRTHIGVDFKRIIGALIADIKAGAPVQGASTITQQLVRNLYLSYEKKLERKIIEAYLAIQLERELTKDQILEAYLNTIPLGQSAFGVQEAAQTYFSKDVSELTIAESALIAGIPKGTSIYAPFFKKRDVSDVNEEDIVGYVYVNGVKYATVFNEKAIERQRLVLRMMKEQGYITEEEYNAALEEDMRKALKPGQKNITGISSYFTDYVKDQVLEALMNEAGYTMEDAERELYTGGLKIYSTMDIELQHKIEELYDNFGNILFGDVTKLNSPVLEEWRRYNGRSGNLDNNNNLVDEYGNIIFYKKGNLLDNNNNLIIEQGTYTLADNGDLIINNRKFNIYSETLDIEDYYTIDEKNNLVTHTVGSLDISNYSTDEVKSAKGKIIIPNAFIKSHTDFYTINQNGHLLISPNYFYNDTDGVVQPQSAVVILDYRTGEIKALVGGRETKGTRLFNRAITGRQPGSSIKPIAVYLPALDNGFTAADIIDDIPYYDSKGNRWPKNWYENSSTYKKYWGLTTLRKAVEYSINVISVKVLERIGIGTSMEYLTRLGIIDEENPENDTFVTRAENPRVNDETLASLGLGGMTKGLTPLDLTAAYGAIANQGIYVEPISFTKIEDRDGNVILEKKSFKNTVVTPQVSYLMTDILKSTVTSGLANRAKIYPGNTNIPVAGKTGTTQEKGDVWFVGYTPYYAAGVWIGNDTPKIKLSEGSSRAAEFWSNIMKKVHEGLEPRDFEIPDGFVKRAICTRSGKLATELCERDPQGSTIRTELFIKGTEPTDYCDIHVEVEIDTSTGKLATENCPPELVEKRVFIKRNPPYNPEEHGGLEPADYQYTVPTDECDAHTKGEDDLFDNWLDWFINRDKDDENENLENSNTIEDVDDDTETENEE